MSAATRGVLDLRVPHDRGGTMTTDEGARAYTSTEATKMAGVSYRQIDYWDRTGVVGPDVRQRNGSGRLSRLYSYRQVQCVALAGRMGRLGVPRKVRKAVILAVQDDPTLWDFVIVVTEDGTVRRRGDHTGALGWQMNLAEIRP